MSDSAARDPLHIAIAGQSPDNPQRTPKQIWIKNARQPKLDLGPRPIVLTTAIHSLGIVLLSLLGVRIRAYLKRQSFRGRRLLS